MARYETMILAEKTLNMQRLEFFKSRNIISNKQKKNFSIYFRKSKNKPISKICGKKNFFLMNLL